MQRMDSSNLLGAGGSNHPGTKVLAQIHRGEPDATGGAVHQQGFSLGQAAPLQPVESGGVVGAERGGGLEGNAVR
jgi:hypothetical protein